MNSFFAIRMFSTRAIFAILVACLFVLQGVVVVHSSGFASLRDDAAGEGLAAAQGGWLCSAQENDKLPAHHRHGASQCCIACAETGRDDAAFLAAAAWIVVAFELAIEPSISITHQFIEDVDGRAGVGWTSAWSSRAPPSLS